MDEPDAAGWTLRSLKEYVEQRFSDDLRALEKAEESVNRRLESMNEFRAQIAYERSQFVTLAKHDQLDDRIDEVRRNYVSNERLDGVVSRIDTRAANFERWQNKIVGALALIVVLVPMVTALGIFLLSHGH